MTELDQPRGDLDLDLGQLVNRGFESPDLDYKAAASWSEWTSAEKAEFIRDLTAMANSDRPGWIIIGVRENDSRSYDGTGLSAEQAAGFDPTPIGLWAANYIQPPVQFRVHKPSVGGKLFVAVQVLPFQSIPHICVKSHGETLHEAAIYVRTDACQTAKVSSAVQLRALVDRATTNSADALVARIDEIFRRADRGASSPAVSAEARRSFDRQLMETRQLPGGTE